MSSRLARSAVSSHSGRTSSWMLTAKSMRLSESSWSPCHIQASGLVPDSVRAALRADVLPSSARLFISLRDVVASGTYACTASANRCAIFGWPAQWVWRYEACSVADAKPCGCPSMSHAASADAGVTVVRWNSWPVARVPATPVSWSVGTIAVRYDSVSRGVMTASASRAPTIGMPSTDRQR